MSLTKAVFYITVVFIAVLYLRLPAGLEKFFNVDEGIGAVVADSILEGGVYYRDSIDQRGPVTYYIYALIFALFGKNNIFALHCGLILIIFAIAVILYLIGVLIADRKTACWAVLFFAVFAHRYSASNMLAFHTEWCAIFFNTAGAYFFLKYLFNQKFALEEQSPRINRKKKFQCKFFRRPPTAELTPPAATSCGVAARRADFAIAKSGLKAGNIFIFFSGLSFSLAFFSKQPALLDFLTALFFCLILNYIAGKKNTRALIKPCIYMAAGFFLPVIIIVSYYRLNNALRDFWFYFWVYNNRYYVAAIPVLQRIKIAFAYFINPKGFLMVNYLLVLSFCAAGFTAVWRFFRNYKKLNRELLIDLYFFFWGISAYIGASYTGRNYGHYFIMILPAFCLLGAKAMQGLFDSVKYYFISNKYKSFFIRVLLIIVISFGMVFPVIKSADNKEFAHGLLSGKTVSGVKFLHFSLWDYGNTLLSSEEFFAKQRLPLLQRELDALVRYMRSRSAAHEKIFVWGFYPEIYALTGLMPASRYTYCNFLTGLLPWVNVGKNIDTSATVVPGSWDIFMGEIKKNMPLYIVDTSLGDYKEYGKYPLYKFEKFFHFISDNYALDRMFFRRDMKIAFVLFKRKDNKLSGKLIGQ